MGSIVRINAIFSGICKYSTTLVPTFSSFFAGSLLNLTGILLPWTDFVLAKAPYQPNSRTQGERLAALQVSAADHLNDGFPQTSQLAVGFFLSHERLLLAGSSYPRRSNIDSTHFRFRVESRYCAL